MPLLIPQDDSKTYDIYFNGHDGARYMIPDVPAASFDEAALQYYTGAIKGNPTHRFVEGRDENDASHRHALNLVCNETQKWKEYEDDELAVLAARAQANAADGAL